MTKTVLDREEDHSQVYSDQNCLRQRGGPQSGISDQNVLDREEDHSQYIVTKTVLDREGPMNLVTKTVLDREGDHSQVYSDL